MPSGARPNPPAHVVHALVSGDVDGSYPWANSFWIRNGNETEPAVSDLQALAADIFTAYDEQLLHLLTGETHLTSVECVYYGVSGADMGASQGGSAHGDASGINTPMNVACCISWKVQQRYKGGHPRTYLPGISFGAIDNPTSFTSDFVSDVASNANAFHASINGSASGDLSDLHLGVVSFVLHNAWRTPPVFRDYTLESATVDTRIDSMRRRLGRDR